MYKYIVEDGFSKITKTGIGQYTIMVENILSKLDLETITISKDYLEKIKNRTIRRIIYLIWLNTFFLLKLLLINKPTIVFFTNFAIPIFKLPNVKYISVVHDLCPFKFPECSSKLINNYEKNNIKNAIKNSDKIITVSNTVKQEICEMFNVSEDKVFVAYNTIPQYFIDAKDNNLIFQKFNIKPKKYILSVATLNKRKNIPMLIDAFNEISDKYPDIKLVLIGGMGSEYKEKLSNSNKNIIFTGYVEDSMMPTFYKNALLYVYPSIYEGFGIPIIEAQYSKTPLLCSNIDVFKEVAKDGAEYCSLNEEDMASKIEYLLNNQQRMNELVEVGYKNVERFSMTKISEQLMEVFS